MELDLLSADNDGKFTLTATSKQLLAGVEGSQRDFVTMINAPYNQQAWGAISDGKALKTGKSAFEAVHGESFWSYVTKRPKLEAEFGGAMTSFTAAAAASTVGCMIDLSDVFCRRLGLRDSAWAVRLIASLCMLCRMASANVKRVAVSTAAVPCITLPMACVISVVWWTRPRLTRCRSLPVARTRSTARCLGAALRGC